MIIPLDIPKDKIIELYVDNKLSMHETAIRLHCSESTIQHRLDEYGIPRRSKSEGRARYLRSHPEAMAKLLGGQVRFSEKRWEDMTDEERSQFLKERTDKLTIGRNEPEAIEKQRQGMIEANENNPEIAKNHSVFMKQFVLDNPEFTVEQTAKLNAGLNASWKSPEGREKRIQALLKTWQNQETKEKHIRATLKGNQVRPTNIEQTVIDVINEYNLPYKYVGNGEVIIEGKNPDFINVNGLKSVIEVYGRYWHQIEDEPERIEFFGRYGFRTLILWDREIENVPHEEIYQKILKFTEECMVEFRKSHPIVTA